MHIQMARDHDDMSQKAASHLARALRRKPDGEMAHFVDCVLSDRPPLVTGEDGRAVLEVVMAAYESARTGRKVALPFQSAAKKPIDLWWAAAEAMRTGEI